MRIIMFQKLAPLIVLGLFVAGMYFMLKGMDNAVELAKPTAKTTTEKAPISEPTIQKNVESTPQP